MGLSRSMSHMPEPHKPSEFTHLSTMSFLWNVSCLVSHLFNFSFLWLAVPSVMVRSDTDVLKSSPAYARSMSAPSDMPGVQDDSVLDIIRLQRLVDI